MGVVLKKKSVDAIRSGPLQGQKSTVHRTYKMYHFIQISEWTPSTPDYIPGPKASQVEVGATSVVGDVI